MLIYVILGFIRSFITESYIAPLQGYYSEALPTLARLKRRVLRLKQNVSERILESNRCAKGRPFHTEGPTTENARPELWRYEQKEQRVTPVSMSGVNCDLWGRGGTAKISEVYLQLNTCYLKTCFCARDLPKMFILFHK